MPKFIRQREMRQKLVSIVIVSYNGKYLLNSCLNSLYAQTYENIELLVVDNASSDGSVEFIRDNFKDVTIIEQKENLGFAKGNNVALKLARGEYVAMLNNDAIAEKEWLSELVNAMELNRRIGICASKILFYNNRDIINSTGICIDKALGFTWDRGFGDKDGDKYREKCMVFGACAAAALYRKDMLDQIGLFDEDFFAYHEDVDLAWRAQLYGWKCIYVPTAIVYHHFSATAGTNSPLKEYFSSRNRIWLIIKNYPSPQIYRYGFLIFSAMFGHLLYALLSGNIYSVKGKISALTCLKRFLNKRKLIQQNKTVKFYELSNTWEKQGLFRSFVNFINFRKSLKYVKPL